MMRLGITGGRLPTNQLSRILDSQLMCTRSASSKPATIEQHLMDQNKKSKEFIQGFKEQVAEGRERVQETLAKLKQDLCAPSPQPPSLTYPPSLTTPT
jgi:hypothetical protein